MMPLRISHSSIICPMLRPWLQEASPHTEILNSTPSAFNTRTTVSNRGLAPGLRALYRLSRPSPEARAISLIPLARATWPMASISSLWSPLARTWDRYSAMVASLSRWRARSKGWKARNRKRVSDQGNRRHRGRSWQMLAGVIQLLVSRQRAGGSVGQIGKVCRPGPQEGVSHAFMNMCFYAHGRV